MSDEYIILKTYKSIWSFERSIHSFEGYKLLIPINVRDAAFYGIGLLLSALIPDLLFALLPGALSIVVKYGVLPYLIMNFLKNKKLDGKTPHRFFWRLLCYQLSPKRFEKFRPVEVHKKVKIKSKVGCRSWQQLDKTDLLLKGQ